MTEQELSEIEQRANLATPGPWHYWHDDDWMAMNCYGVTTDPCANGPEDDHEKFIALTLYQATPLVGIGDGLHHDNTAFIAHARTDIPALIAALRGAWRKIDELKEEQKFRELGL